MSVYYKENPEYLKLAIESMINQTFKPDQFVIVEDGRLTTELYAVLNKYSLDYPELFYRLPLEKNCGLGIALDKGLQLCRNQLIARMDSDDIAVRDRCEKQISIFNDDPSLDIVSGTIAEFDDDINSIRYRRVVPQFDNEIKKQMRTRSPFNHPAVMYKKSTVIRCGGYGNSVRKEDHDLFSRMLNMGSKAYNIQEDILFYRSGENSIKRRKNWKNIKSYIEIMWINLKRGYCDWGDFIFVFCAQIFYFIAPVGLIDFLLKRFFRK